ncbi:zinc metalloprotease [Halegenticoccus soli]|uniref:matrixin n=1 Tax=Halegenticoccus soli TaxID=1985678 RepID=UPI000C6D2529|nr:matrixin [Halegenticoccus soli]
MSSLRAALIPVALAAALVFAGCVLPVPVGGPSDSVGPTETPSASRGDDAAGGGSPGAETPTPTPVEPRPSPWGDEPIVVAVENPGEPGRDFVPLVRDATAYWEENAERFAGYPVSYRVEPDAEDPDVVVRFVDDVRECGDAHEAAGCAPLVTDERQVADSDPLPVYVKTGLSNDSTRLVLKHELGHTLGLTHDDAPREVMRGASVLYTEPRPNATERAFPWRDGTFAVYVDTANASDPEEAREQIGHVLEYYERGADGSVPDNLTFRTVDSPDEADVVVRFGDESTCPTGSCAATAGPDVDGDGAIEYYTRLRIVLAGVDTEAVGWHVGNWIAYGLGAEEQRERPEPFRDASYEERRGEWWR